MCQGVRDFKSNITKGGKHYSENSTLSNLGSTSRSQASRILRHTHATVQTICLVEYGVSGPTVPVILDASELTMIYIHDDI